MTFVITAPNSPPAPPTPQVGIGFSDTLPAGLVVSTPNGLTGSCGGGTITATAGSSMVTLAGATLAPGASCTFAVNVDGKTLGTKHNCATVSSVNGGTGNTSCADLLVYSPPGSDKKFLPDSVLPNVRSTMTITVTNVNPTLDFTGLAFSDSLPSGMAVASPNGVVNTCGGAVSAPSGGGTVALTGGTLPHGGSCSVAVDVTASPLGDYTNCVIVTTTNAGSAQQVCAILHVVDQPPNPPDDPCAIRYFSNLTSGDSLVNVSNAGTSTVHPQGHICANFYVFDPDEELLACCACKISPNAIKSVSLTQDVTPYMVHSATSLIIKLVATTPAAGVCNPALVTTSNLATGMRAWATTIHAQPIPPGGFGVTETRFARCGLPPADLALLTTRCAFLQQNGSGYGICRACRDGGL
jgi:hypothetical protein